MTACWRTAVDTVRLNNPVRSVRWSDNGVTINTDTIEVQARQVILAGPPTLMGAIEFVPSLPVSRAQITQHWPQGLVIKIGMVCDRPFWRDDGLSGLSLDYSAMVSETADSSAPPEYSAAGVLTGFIYTDQARAASLLSAADRRQRMFGGDGRAIRGQGADARATHRDELVDAGLNERMLRRLPRAGRDLDLSLGGPRPRRPAPLGRYGNVARVANVH